MNIKDLFSKTSKRFNLALCFNALLALFLSSNLAAQCPESLGCNDKIQISLGYDCSACITPELILEDEKMNCDYLVEIKTLEEVVIAETTFDPLTGDPIHPCIDGSYIGQEWIASVSFFDDNNTKISCWGFFTVEDKLPPVITCIDDLVVDCNEDLSGLFTSSSTTTYTYDGTGDKDSDAATVTLSMCTAGTLPRPWEVANTISLTIPGAPLTGVGQASINGNSVGFDITAGVVDGNILGSQVDFDNCISITLPISAVPAGVISMTVNSVSFHEYQFEDNCDPNLEVLIAHDETVLQACVKDTTAVRTIRYYTKDDAGISPGFCEFDISFLKKELEDIDFPANYTRRCDLAPMNNGELDLSPANTGLPTLEGFPLMEGDNLCRMNVTFADDTFNLCGANTLKILRRWTALDWCHSIYAQSYQTIKIEDDGAPVVSCQNRDFSIVATNGCKADYELKPFDNTDPSGAFVTDCSAVTVRVEYLKAGDRDINDPELNWLVAPEIRDGVFRASGLEGGMNWVRYFFEDECGNEEFCAYEITVTNGGAPIPVCDQYTVVSLDEIGWGRVYAQSVDDGSYDACGAEVDLHIKRDSPCTGYSSDSQFGDFVSFCCKDAGDSIKVTLRVTAPNGLSNTCHAYVVVQNKSEYVVTCPSTLNFVLKCDQINNIDPNTSSDPRITEKPTVTNNCGDADVVIDDNLDFDDECGDGQLTRRWFVNVNGQRQELTQCKQTFVFESNLSLTESDFAWPADRDDATCENYTEDMGDAPRYPRVGGVPVNEATVCGNLTYTFEDRVFHDVEGYCVKVIRTWTIIDWCLKDSNPNNFSWSRNQVIKVSDATGPEFTNCPDDVVIDIENDDCMRSVNFTAPTATDLCLDEVIDPRYVSWAISGTTRTGTGNIPSTSLAPGSYTVTWSATGVCGATSNTCTHSITINDKKAPVPYCLGGVTTVLMEPSNAGQDPYVELWASDFVLDNTDSCGNTHDLSFAENTIQANMTFDCEDLGMTAVRIWFFDNAGNKDFCDVTVDIQANNGICDVGTGGMIAGQIQTEWHEKVEGVEVAMMRMSDTHMNYNMTNNAGDFAFSNTEYNSDYHLSVSGNDDYLNGVSTLDLLLIQKHILGTESLDSPYKVIAADIDQSESITAIDLIELRKLILGIYDELPYNDSWKFVDKEQEFANIYSPWPISENLNIYGFNQSSMENDFIAVKIGDVNNNVVLGATDNSEVKGRSAHTIELTTEVLKINANEYLVPIYMKEVTDIRGMQFNLDLMTNGLSVLEVESGKLNMLESNYNITDDAVKVVWHSSSLQTVKPNEAMFYLTVKSDKPLNENAIALSNTGLRSEVYLQDLNTVDLSFDNSQINGDPVLFQNSPNPFSDNTEIAFSLSSTQNYELNILSTNGQIVKTIRGEGIVGINRILIQKSELGNAGIFYYQLKSGNFLGSKKMILVE